MRRAVTAVFVGCLLLLASCSSEPVVLLDYDFYNWAQLNEDAIAETVPGHGSGVRNIFINAVGTFVTTSTPEDRTIWDYPEGTVIIKTVGVSQGVVETESTAPAAMLFGMIKDSTHPANLGGWIWLTRNPNTGEEQLFDTEFCVTCHADANEKRTLSDRIPTGMPNPEREFRDFVFFPYYASQ